MSEPVPADGTTIGEIASRGDITLMGCLYDPVVTDCALAGQWFWTGDLAVIEHDGYIEIKDRSKGIIISGGEYFVSRN
ncbi:fatty-acyl-CoA synthase [Pseudoduganella lurida]|uniref:Fatty-acyl-CoA synthase n=1 Tax=Pseudoduganella lurida TaxID=1036180 RepID=A0A562RJK1_9BURK|nr:AMP-binding protein [Pseudoduganella lurida]TWI69245.1 fatty-acyl-CoA synthase [Pseudoduganella lurida]